MKGEYNKMSVEKENIIIKKPETADEIDLKNFKKISDISTLANQKLDDFDKTYNAPDFSELLKSLNTKEESKSEELFELKVEAPQEDEKPIAIHKERARMELTVRAKLMISVYSVIVLLLGALMIYNAVSIGNYNASIAQNKQILAVEQQNLTEMEAALESLQGTATAEVSSEISQITSISRLDVFDKLERPSYTKDTNLFDKICELFSGLFGG